MRNWTTLAVTPRPRSRSGTNAPRVELARLPLHNLAANSSRRPTRTDVGDEGNTTEGYAPNGAGRTSGNSGRTTVNLKRTEMVGKFNDDEAEKRKRRKSAKLLGQQLTLFDGLTDPGPVVNG
ncbi:hypothetical protein BDM02DRAFT_876738 [Thelephora ganbajun]|uniref:Uncharacterized protein n=1 Tax=Thelephora ganbajun TaxID=370292 RepID=A0ACB6Z577_THEGA|nr:hypothetical protein BDM02DRAFT_876738 [Thelephora ganbajun]